MYLPLTYRSSTQPSCAMSWPSSTRKTTPASRAWVGFASFSRPPTGQRLAPVVKSLVSSDRLRVALVLEACTWKEIDEAALLRDPLVARFDPRLESVTNLNSPEDYSAAKEHAEPLVQVRLLGDGRPDKPGLSAMVVVRETTAGSDSLPGRRGDRREPPRWSSGRRERFRDSPGPGRTPRGG